MIFGYLGFSLISQGSESAYFTVFAASYLPVHVTKVEKAENVWSNNLGTPFTKSMLTLFAIHLSFSIIISADTIW